MLFWKECKKIVRSLTFVLYLVTVVLMYVSQFGEVLGEPIEPPRQGQRDYGTVVKEDPEILMPAAVQSLVAEYMSGSYTAYPLLFYRQVRLSEAKRDQMAEIITELTGLSAEELNHFTGYEEEGFYAWTDENGEEQWGYRGHVLPEYELSADLTYERFRELMKEADRLIGGGSEYSDQFLARNFGRAPMTYEEALAEYEEVMAEDNIAQAYTRLFCDYLGIVLSVLPVFVCVSLWIMDQRSDMEQLIYGRRCSTVKLVGTRQLALWVCMCVPVLLVWLHGMVSVQGLYPDTHFALGSALGLMALWLFPSILIVSAFGALLAELSSPLPAIFLQAAWWFISLTSNSLTGSITKYTLIIRHNDVSGAALFQSQYGNFVINRCGYIVLSLVCVGLTMFFYEMKRKGVLALGKGSGKKSRKALRRNRQIQSEA